MLELFHKGFRVAAIKVVQGSFMSMLEKTKNRMSQQINNIKIQIKNLELKLKKKPEWMGFMA